MKNHSIFDRPDGRETAIAMIGERTDQSGDCWLWTAYLTPEGYGYVSLGKTKLPAHRAAYEAYVGPIAAGMQIDHLCRVRHCVNPAHLEAVTPQLNVQRSDSANRRKTRCPAGHPYDEANTRWTDRGRVCRACHRASALRYYYKAVAR